ncbi:Gustatory receptor 13 [Cephus cinctus]|uniref:Gustatory receptor n=1 Tax=Cephus cinctus TaxID=211228 RepID=A0A3L9LTG0_CEPCN|nr:uncharacterized protein LOC107270362 [Cephus cinctus]RLZ02226.1 Gustatory receptor 13 [Cephus cinctus]
MISVARQIIMSILRPLNVREESYIIFLLKGVLGLRPVGYFKKIPGFLYIFILITAYVVLFVYVAEYAENFFENFSVYSVSSKFRNFDTNFNLIFVPIVIIIGVTMARRIDRIFDEIIKVDQQFSYLNGHFDYFGNFRREVIHVTTLLFITSIISAADYHGLRNANVSRTFVLLWIVNFVPRIVDAIVSSAFVTLLAKIRDRFAKLNDLIYMPGENAKVGAVSRLDVASRALQFRRLHSDLNAISRDINDTYRFQLLISIMVILMRTCGHLNIITKNYNDVNHLVDIILSIIWSIFEIGLLIYITSACHNVKKESELIRDLLTHRHEFREIQSSHPIMTNDNVKFYLFHMFVIDYPFFGVVIMGLLGYIFILSQTSSSDS